MCSASLQPASLSATFYAATTRRVWCNSPKPEYNLPRQRFLQVVRCIPLMRPRDLILLPRNEVCVQSWRFYKDLLGLTNDQVIWTSGEAFHLDADVTEEVISQLMTTFSDSDGSSHAPYCMANTAKWLLLPYAINESFLSWASGLLELPNVFAFGETASWTEMYGDKGILHRHMSSLNVPSVVETIDLAGSIVVPRGYVCTNHTELVAARALLSDVEVVIKPLKGATGVGIILKPDMTALEAYDFPLGDVNLEEFLALDLDEQGEAVSPAIHFMGNRIVGHSVDQIMDGCSFAGWKTTTVSTEFQERTSDMMQLLLASLQPQGAGGVDFLSVEGKPVLTDINFARFNGCHPPKLFLEEHCPDGIPYIWNLRVPDEQLENCPSLTAWYQALAINGLAFSSQYRGRFRVAPKSAGVFPLVHIEGLRMTCIAIGDDAASAEALMFKANTLWEELVQGYYLNADQNKHGACVQEDNENEAGKAGEHPDNVEASNKFNWELWLSGAIAEKSVKRINHSRSQSWFECDADPDDASPDHRELIHSESPLDTSVQICTSRLIKLRVENTAY